MQSEGQSTEHDALQEDIERKTIICPNCEGTVPSTLYCLKCGYPLFNLLEEKEENGESDSVGAKEFFNLDPLKGIQDEAPLVSEEDAGSTPVPLDAYGMRSGIELALEPGGTDEGADLNEAAFGESVVAGDSVSENEDLSRPEKMLEAGEEMVVDGEPMTGILEPASHQIENEESRNDSIADMLEEGKDRESEHGADPKIAELAKELMNSISLQLWSVNLLREGGVGEDHFNNIFQGYQTRFERCMAQRNEMLEEARDTATFEKKVNEAKVELGELEVRRSLGDLHEGEYEAMTPALRWIIDHNEDMIAKREAEVALLEDLHQLMPADKIAETEEMAETAHEALERLNDSENIGSETVSRIRASLEDIMAYLEDR